MHKKLIAIIVVILFIIAIAGFTITKKDETVTVSDAPKIPIEICTAQAGSMQEGISITGNLEAYQQIMIIPTVPGKVATLHVELGDEIAIDDILIELDEADMQTQVDLAWLGVKMAKLNLESAQDAYDASQEQETSQEEQNENQKTLTDEINNLFDEGQITEEQRDYLIEQVEANEGFDTPTLISSISGDPKSNLEKAQLGVQQANLQYSAAKSQRDSMSVYSPINGVVTYLSASEGNYVSSSQPPIIISDLSKVILQVGINEFEINKISKDQSVNLTVDSMADEEFKGTIIGISYAPDMRTQMYTVKIEIDNPEILLKPGMLTRGEIITQTKEETMLIPIQCLITSELESSVYVYNEDATVKKISIETGSKNSKYIEVLSGLTYDDYIVITGQEYIYDNANVTVTNNDSFAPEEINEFDPEVN